MCQVVLGLIRFEDNITNLSSNHLFCLDHLPGKIFPVNISSYKYQFNYLTVHTMGKIACKVNTQKVTQAMDNFLYYTVDTSLLHYYAVNILKERMF